MKAALLFSLFIAVGFISQAQNDALSVSYDSVPFKDLVRDIESKTKFKFYYTDAWVDTLVVTASFTNALPSTIVEKVLQNTSTHHYIIDDKIILTHNVPILDKIDTTLFVEFQNLDASKWSYSFQRELIPEDKDTEKENTVAVIGVA